MKEKLIVRSKANYVLKAILLLILFSFSSLNAQTITPASGGTNISLDKSSAGITPAWTMLSGPVITETLIGQFIPSDYYMFLPNGWKFDVTQPITITVGGSDATFALSSSTYTPTAQMLVFHVSRASTTAPVTLTFNNIKVQPTGTTPSSDMIRCTILNNANFGPLSSVIGSERAFRITAASGTPMAGTTDQLSISIVDQFQNVITTYTGDRNITFSGLGTAPNGTSIPTVTNKNGAAVNLGTTTQIHFSSGVSDVGGLLSVFKAEGPVSLNATDGIITSSAAGGTGAALTVSPTAMNFSTSKVTVSQAIMNIGGVSTITLQATDTYGNNLTANGATVVFTNTTGVGVCTGTLSAVTDNGNGKYTATFTALTKGTATTIYTTYNGAAVTSTAPTITVVDPGNPNAYRIIATSNTPTAGATDQLTITLVDQNQITITSFNGTKDIVFSGLATALNGSSVPTITNSSGTPINLGTATTIHFTAGVSDAGGLLTAYKAEGPVMVNATDGTLSTTSTGGSGVQLTIAPSAVNYTTTTVSASQDSIYPAGTSTVTLQAKDSYLNNLTTGGATVAFTLSGGTSVGTFSTVADNSNGSYSSVFTGTTPGTAVTINATYNSNNISSTLPTITVLPEAISLTASTVAVSATTVVAGSSVTVTLQAKKTDGSNITTGGATVVFTHSGGTSTGTFSAITDHSNGTYTALFTGNKSGTPTTINASVGGSAITSTLPTVTVTNGVVTYLKAVPAQNSMITGATNEITLTACDAYGNTDINYSGTKAILFTGLQGTEKIEGSASSANVTFTSGVSVNGNLTFTAAVARDAYLNFSDGVYGTTADISYSAHIIITAAIPSVPVATAASSITTSSFIANWIPSVGATEYFIDVAADAEFTYPISGYINLNVGNVAYVLVTGLQDQTKYYFRVRAGNGTASSESSNIISLTTLQAKPDAPVAKSASLIGDTEFTANWNVSSGATGYFLDVAADNAFTLPVSGYIGKNVANVTSFKVSNLNPETSYYYRVRAYNAQGESDNSNIISLNTLVGVEQIGTEIPTTFTLFQNYPNPFNPTTKIQFSLPKSVMVRLTVYNILGQEVARLFNQELPLGTYSADFDASKLNNGIYFYSLQAGEFSQTKKMILLK